MRALVVVAGAVALVPVGSSLGAGHAPEHNPAPGPTALKATYWEDGSANVPTEVWTLRCTPTGGTLPRPARACRKLAAGGPKLFAPLPSGIACTQIYGGPQTARVVGTVSGKRVRATFSRADGCRIARWNALSPWLLPPGGATR